MISFEKENDNEEDKNNKLQIDILPIKRKSKYKPQQIIPIKIEIKNNDTSLTEKIIKYNIDFKNLKFKVLIEKLDDLNNVIRTKFLNKFYPNPIEVTNYFDYTPKDLIIELNFLDTSFLYRIQTFLVEKFTYSNVENKILYSNKIFVNPFYGILTQKQIENLYKDKFKPKQFLSKSEKDNMKVVNTEIKLKNLNGIINSKDVKEFTYEGRTYDNLPQFLNSKYKASKLMTEKRKKKLLFSTETDIHFSTKMAIQNETKNPFLKNEWFMGPVYSYDYNYNKYI